MRIARIYNDNGQSRFTDIDISLNPTEPRRGVSGLRMSAPFAGGECFIPFLSAVRRSTRGTTTATGDRLSGEAEIETSDGSTRRFRQGDVFLADDTTGSGHIARFLTDVTVLVVPVASIPV
jgi:hypothetical protein